MPAAGKEPEPQRVAEQNNGAGESELNKPLTFTVHNIDRTHAYLEERGFTKETAKTFGVGFFPGRVVRGGDRNGEILADLVRVLACRVIACLVMFLHGRVQEGLAGHIIQRCSLDLQGGGDAATTTRTILNNCPLTGYMGSWNYEADHISPECWSIWRSKQAKVQTRSATRLQCYRLTC